MAFLLKHVDRTTVNYDTSFTYTIEASFNGLTLPEINPAVLVDTVPSYIELDFSAVDPVITYSVQTVGLNKVITFNFPPVTDTGIAYEIDLICKFKDGTLNGSTCTNNAQLYLAGSDTPSFTAIAPTVTLSIKAKWDIDKLMISLVNNNPTPDSIYLDNQEVKRGCTVNLGCSAVNNGEFSSYENNSNYVILNGEGTFMIDYSCYGEFLETPNEKDYIALQLKLNNDFILQGYSYTTENGVLRCR